MFYWSRYCYDYSIRGLDNQGLTVAQYIECALECSHPVKCIAAVVIYFGYFTVFVTFHVQNRNSKAYRWEHNIFLLEIGPCWLCSSTYLSINKNMHSLYMGGVCVINLYCCRSREYDVQMCVKTKYCNIASKKKKSTRRWRFITLLHVLCRNCNAI